VTIVDRITGMTAGSSVRIGCPKRLGHHRRESITRSLSIWRWPNMPIFRDVRSPGVTINPDDNSYGEAELTPAMLRRPLS